MPPTENLSTITNPVNGRSGVTIDRHRYIQRMILLGDPHKQRDYILKNTQRPERSPVRSNIPGSLRELQRWVGWRWGRDSKRAVWAKIPINAQTGRHASSTESSTWATYERALAAYIATRVDGIGIVLGELEDGTNLVGIDLDGCRNPGLQLLSSRAENIIDEIGSYAEISPTSTGVKILLRGRLPDRATRHKSIDGSVEVYESGRYFCLTGRPVYGVPAEVMHRQAELEHVYDRYIGGRSVRPPAPVRSVLPAAGQNSVHGYVAEAALKAMLRIRPREDEHDSSHRLFALCCRAVEHDLSDEETVHAIRAYSQTHPLRTTWTDEQILRRKHDAEARPDIVRGSAVSRINAANPNLAEVTSLAWAAIEQSNVPAKLFRHGGHAVRVESDDEGQPFMQPLTEDRMRHFLARAATWFTRTRSGDEFVERPSSPPKDVVKDVLATPDMPLPVLTRVVEVPVFAPDGTLQIAPGYHPASRTLYAPAPGFALPDIPTHPTQQDLATARTWLRDELIGEFPFTGPSESAHAIALLLLPFVRDLFDGPTPLHVVEKPAPGTGATLLVDVLALPATGRSMAVMSEARSEDEWRKRITARLFSGSPFYLIDNLSRRLDSAALSAALTARTWEDRILGGSKIAHLPVRCAWVATGNNPSFSTEIMRRTVRIRMDARQDHAWLRGGFRHANLRAWAADNRAELVRAALVLVTAWLADGRPAGCNTLGMFEQWAAVMGGILEVAGIDGFLGNLHETYATSDSEAESWRAFFGTWWTQHRDTNTTVAELYSIATDVSLPMGDHDVQGQRIALGRMVGERRDRVYELGIGGVPGRVVVRRGGASHGVTRWRLADAGTQQPGGE